MAIVNIRGTSGSGKTFTANGVKTRLGVKEPLLVKEFWEHQPVGAHLGYLLNQDVALVGKYETACGGCDTIKTSDDVCDRVRGFAKTFQHVLFEGLLVSQVYDRYTKLAHELRDKQFIFAFLDTPLETCLAQVESRRAAAHAAKVAKAEAAGKKPPVLKPLDPTNTIGKWHDMHRVRPKLIQDGHQVVILDHKGDTAAQVLALMGL
jgi:hypothetical protein